jgi:integrase
MALRLNDAAISKAAREVEAAGARRDLSDAGEPGLRLRITPPTAKNRDGTKTWVLAMRDGDGRMRRFPLGTYPAIGVADARTQAQTLRVKVRTTGADPIAEARRRRAITRAAQDGVGTLEALLSLYGGPVPAKARDGESGSAPAKVKAIGPGAGQKSWPTARARIDRVFRKLLSRPLESLTSVEMQMEADAYPSLQIAASAVRCIRPVIKWGAERSYVAEVVAKVRPPAQVNRRDRVLSRDELAALLPHLTASENPYRRAFLFMLLTLARREEVAGARWRDIDLEAETLRLPTTKNGLPHVIPLSRKAMELIRSTGTGKGDDLVFAVRGGGRLANWDRETKALMKLSKTEAWTRHDLRRSGATMLGDLGVEPHVIEAALNHAAIHSSLATLYNRSRYLPQVRDALQRLADRLDGIAAGGANVVRLADRRA